jgi:hypothetical protein
MHCAAVTSTLRQPTNYWLLCNRGRATEHPSSATVAAGELAYGSTCYVRTDMAQNRFKNIR